MEYVLYSFIWWQLLSITVVSSGYHRYFAHKSFNAPIWYEWYVLMLGLLTGGGSIVGWVGVHRMHHKHESTENDPHSPHHVGLWKVLLSTFSVPNIGVRVVRDMLKNPRVMFVHRYYKILRFATLVVPLFILPLEWYLVLIISPAIYAWVGFGLINAFCHDQHSAKNSYLLNILAGGDGFHKNHHDDPGSWKIGKTWYQLDPGAWWIYMIMKRESKGGIST